MVDTPGMFARHTCHAIMLSVAARSCWQSQRDLHLLLGFSLMILVVAAAIKCNRRTVLSVVNVLACLRFYILVVVELY